MYKKFTKAIISSQSNNNYKPYFKGFTFLSSIGLGLCPFKSLSLPGLAYLGNKSLRSKGLSKIINFDYWLKWKKILQLTKMKLGIKKQSIEDKTVGKFIFKGQPKTFMKYLQIHKFTPIDFQIFVNDTSKELFPLASNPSNINLPSRKQLP